MQLTSFWRFICGQLQSSWNFEGVESLSVEMWKRSVFYFFLYYLVRSASSACYDSTVCLQKPYLSCCERENSIRDQCGINGVSSHSRIYGGRPASEGDLPWMAVLYYTRRRDPQCGASVINRWFLVTAAHCLTGEAINKHLGEPWAFISF